jgi:dihydroneopterin aldolase
VPEHLDNNTVDQKYNVIIKNLIVDASIGIHEHEKIKKQRVSISLSIEVVDNISLVDQKIENFLSYENVINNIKLIINKGHIDLVETLSYEILSNIFSDSRASKVWLKIEKLDVFAEAQSVGLEIIKTRKNFIKSSNSQNIKKLKNK